MEWVERLVRTDDVLSRMVIHLFLFLELLIVTYLFYHLPKGYIFIFLPLLYCRSKISETNIAA